jgi:hypothetical protein
MLLGITSLTELLEILSNSIKLFENQVHQYFGC